MKNYEGYTRAFDNTELAPSMSAIDTGAFPWLFSLRSSKSKSIMQPKMGLLGVTHQTSKQWNKLANFYYPNHGMSLSLRMSFSCLCVCVYSTGCPRVTGWFHFEISLG